MLKYFKGSITAEYLLNITLSEINDYMYIMEDMLEETSKQIKKIENGR